MAPNTKNTKDLCSKLQDERGVLNEIRTKFYSETFIDNVCLSFRHDFGLLSELDKQHLRFECKEWMRAIENNWIYFK